MAYKAHVKSWSFEIGTRIAEHFWAIHKSVGWGCPNNTDDVMLVQYLINSWAKKKILETDGIFGNKTYNAIKNYQKWRFSEESGVVKIDGRVTATDGEDYETQKGHIYTILLLNGNLFDRLPAYYNDIRMDRLLPTGLCNALSAAAAV